MTNETKHTPTPWEVESDNHKEIGQVELGRFRLKSGKRPIIDGYILNEEDAAHIVKCVNMYEELVEALKVLFYSYKDLADSGDAGFWKIEDKTEGKQALVALEKAGAL